MLKYEELVQHQLRESTIQCTTKHNASETEARFMSNKTRFTTWLQFKSQGDAAFVAYGSRDAKFCKRVNSSIYAGDEWRAKQKNKWVFRNRPPMRLDVNKRGWHLVRRLVKMQPVLRALLKSVYRPEGPAHMRLALEIEQMFEVTTMPTADVAAATDTTRVLVTLPYSDEENVARLVVPEMTREKYAQQAVLLKSFCVNAHSLLHMVLDPDYFQDIGELNTALTEARVNEVIRGQLVQLRRQFEKGLQSDQLEGEEFLRFAWNGVFQLWLESSKVVEYFERQGLEELEPFKVEVRGARLRYGLRLQETPADENSNWSQDATKLAEMKRWLKRELARLLLDTNLSEAEKEQQIDELVL